MRNNLEADLIVHSTLISEVTDLVEPSDKDYE